MELETLIKNLKKRKSLLLSITLLVLALVAVITFLQPLKYSVKSRLLIAQNISGADPYTVSKSNQYLSNLFSQVIYSSSFFDLVNNAGYNIDDSYFGYNYKRQMKTWKKTVRARSVGDTGILEVYVYHPNTYQAQQISLAVNHVLINQSSNYQKAGNHVSISVIDQPLTSNYPVKPNIILNLIFGLIIGLSSTILYIYLFPIKNQVKTKVKINTNSYAPNNLPGFEQREQDEIKKRKLEFEEEEEIPKGDITNILR